MFLLALALLPVKKKKFLLVLRTASCERDSTRYSTRTRHTHMTVYVVHIFLMAASIRSHALKNPRPLFTAAYTKHSRISAALLMLLGKSSLLKQVWAIGRSEPVALNVNS